MHLGDPAVLSGCHGPFRICAVYAAQAAVSAVQRVFTWNSLGDLHRLQVGSLGHVFDIDQHAMAHHLFQGKGPQRREAPRIHVANTRKCGPKTEWVPRSSTTSLAHWPKSWNLPIFGIRLAGITSVFRSGIGLRQKSCLPNKRTGFSGLPPATKNGGPRTTRHALHQTRRSWAANCVRCALNTFAFPTILPGFMSQKPLRSAIE